MFKKKKMQDDSENKTYKTREALSVVREERGTEGKAMEQLARRSSEKKKKRALITRKKTSVGWGKGGLGAEVTNTTNARSANSPNEEKQISGSRPLLQENA